MGNKLENLLSFEDFDKSGSWKPKEQKSTKRTEVGVDVLNENLYMKVMDQTASGWKENVKKFIQSIMKAVYDNQIKDIEVSGNSVTFTIRGRKHKINKEAGSITLWRKKSTAFRKKLPPDEAGREREERKRTKVVEDIEVTIPISKAEGTAIFNALKERAED